MKQMLVFLMASAAFGGGRYLEVEYPPSTEAGGLQVGVTYTLWVPEGAPRLRGIIVHQHGCGSGACKGGATAAYDLHWQALARKWNCALLGPSYHQDDKQACTLWDDPRNGSDRAFQRAISEFAVKSGHSELESAPWCLWGHSGGGVWSGLMEILHPERIVAVWFRSGTAMLAPSVPEVPNAVYSIPMMCNPGVKEKGDKRFDRIWTANLETFKAFRNAGAPIGFAPDPRTMHECGDSRYLAIPFFDACLAMRLPDRKSNTAALKPVSLKAGWLAPLLGDTATPAASYSGRADEAVWLPDERVAKAWQEYVKSGAVTDRTPPPVPLRVNATPRNDGSVEIVWEAEADFESGIRAFMIQRDGRDLAEVPQKPVGKFGRPLFQPMSYHDTPEAPLPEMRFIDQSPESGKHTYTVIEVNGEGLKSTPKTTKIQVASPASSK